MNLCRCERGHFYDKEKFATCPHCAGGGASDEKLTEAFTEDVTVPMNGASAPQMTPPPVAPAFNPQPQPAQPIFNPQPAAPQMTPPPAPGFGVPPVAQGFSANDVTVGVDQVNGGYDPTVPLEAESDDDHTVGFFDDVFQGAAKEVTKPGAPAFGGAAPQAQPVNKVSTPCVGWLVALGGEHIGTDFRLKTGKNFIGRSPQMDIALTDDKSVSRERHAIVVYDPKSNMYLVQPGESSSLAYHNNNLLLTPEKLEAYDMVTVGDVNLLFMPLCSEKFSWGNVLEEMKKKQQ